MPFIPPAVEPPAITFQSPIPGRWAGITALRLKVLVVDDNRDAADTLAGLLLTVGADVRVCYDGPSAVATAEKFRPDAGLFDIYMPGMDGCELARRVRALAGRRPLFLVAVTGVSTPTSWHRTTEAGFNVHVTKPADPAALVSTLADFDWWLRSRGHPPAT
jgi:CheY-like chemotaxis protein